MKKIILFASFVLLFGLVGCGESTTTTTSNIDTTKNITIYTRDTTSGTREAFFSGIGFNDAINDSSVLANGYVEVASNGAMVSAVQGDEYGIGYISLSSLPGSNLNGLTYNGVAATEDNVLSGTYGLKRPFNYIIRSDWTGLDTEHQIVEAFLAYMFTVDGKTTIMNHNGIISIADTDKLWDDIKVNYPVCTLDNSGVTVKFGGSTSVQDISEALSAEFSAKCGNFIDDHNHTGSGDAYKRVQGTEAYGANQLDIGFASRPFEDTEPAAAGTTGQICWDAVVVVVNQDNHLVANITTDEIKKIYEGTTSVWSQLA